MAHFCFSLLGKFVLSHQDFFLSSFFAFFLFSLVLHNLFQLFLVIPFSIHVHCFPVVRSIKRNFCPINEQGKYFRANIYIKREHGKGWLDLFKETANTNELRGVIAFLFRCIIQHDCPRIYSTLSTIAPASRLYLQICGTFIATEIKRLRNFLETFKLYRAKQKMLSICY